MRTMKFGIIRTLKTPILTETGSGDFQIPTAI